MDVQKENKKIIKYSGMIDKYNSIDELYNHFFYNRGEKKHIGVHYLINYFEKALLEQLDSGDVSEKDIPKYIEISCMVYEALAIATMDPFGVPLYLDIKDEYEKKRFECNVISHFKKISPLNFFKLINDLSVQKFYTSSREVADRFFINSNELKRINKFYDELRYIYIENFNHRYSLIYLYVIITTNYLNKYCFLKNAIELAGSKDIEKRNIARFIINIFLNELITKDVKNTYGKDDLYYKMGYINTNINTLITSDINVYKLYSINSIYNYIKKCLS